MDSGPTIDLSSDDSDSDSEIILFRDIPEGETDKDNESSSPKVGRLIDVDDNFVYLLKDSKIKVVKKSLVYTDPIYKHIATSLEKRKERITNKMMSGEQKIHVAHARDPIKDISCVTHDALNPGVQEHTNKIAHGNIVVTNGCSAYNSNMAYYSYIPVYPMYYSSDAINTGVPVEAKLKPKVRQPVRRTVKRARRRRMVPTVEPNVNVKVEPITSPPLPELTSTLSNTTYDCQLCKQVFPSVHSLASHRCPGIGQWREELNGKWWKNFKS